MARQTLKREGGAAGFASSLLSKALFSLPSPTPCYVLSNLQLPTTLNLSLCSIRTECAGTVWMTGNEWVPGRPRGFWGGDSRAGGAVWLDRTAEASSGSCVCSAADLEETQHWWCCRHSRCPPPRSELQLHTGLLCLT